MDRRPQRADGPSLGRRQCRPDTDVRERISRPATRRDPRSLDSGDRCTTAGDADYPDCICGCFRPGRRWLRCQPATSGREPYRLHPYGSVVGGKWLELLTEIAPGVKRATIMFNPDTAPYARSYYLPSFEAAARSLKVAPIVAPVHSEGEIETVITSLGREPGGGLVVLPDTFSQVHRATIILLAARNNVPAAYCDNSFAVDGGLFSYGPDQVDIFRRAAPYVDRILKGERPADLPVQAPTKYILVINLKTAKALGLDVPVQLRQLADDVIE
ncbi:MAG: ABC transporter substrate-binding protein [Xanthobacteraceae bacterium]